MHGWGHYGDTVWLRIQVTNPGPTRAEPVLELDNIRLDHVHVWIDTPAGWDGPWPAGEDSEVDQRLSPHLKPRVPLSLDPGQTTTVYFRLQDEGTLVAPLLLGPREPLDQAWQRRQILNGALSLVLAWMILGTVLLGIFERQRLLGWLAAALLGLYGVHIFYFWGVGGELLPAAIRGPLVNRVNAAMAIVVFPALTGFTARALDLTTHLPRLTRFTWGVVALLTLNAILIIVGPYSKLLAFSHVGGMLCLGSLGIAASLRARAGDVVARFLLGAYLAHALVGVLLAARTMGVTRLAVDGAFAFGIIAFVTFLLAAVYWNTRELRRHEKAAREAQLNTALQNARLSDMFERFVPKEFLGHLGTHSFDEVRVGQAVERRMSVLFADLRGFTTAAEAMTPRDTFRLINEYLGAIEPIIRDHGGFVDKFMGDGVMALFPAEQSTDGAVAAGVALFQALEQVNAQRTARGGAPLRMGVGIQVGPLTLGTIGGPGRISATAIGDSVNAASRIESMTKRYETNLMISGQVLAATTGRFRSRLVDVVRLPGKSQPVELHEVLDALPGQTRAQRESSVADWRQAWDLYQRGLFDQAGQLFTDISDATGADVAATTLARRCARLAASPLRERRDAAVPALTK